MVNQIRYNIIFFALYDKPELTLAAVDFNQFRCKI